MTAAERGALRRVRALVADRVYFAHVADVYGRVERLTRRDPATWPLRVAALVHEEPRPHVLAVLETAGLSVGADRVLAVLDGFGAVWRHGVEAWVRRHRASVADVVRFELAHEGRPAARMRDAAALGGFLADFDRWATTLTARGGSPARPRRRRVRSGRRRGSRARGTSPPSAR